MRRVAVALSVTLVASACAAAGAPTEPVVLRVVMADDWASAPIVGEVIDAFEAEHDGVRVQVQPTPFSQVPDLVAEAADLGEPYDLAHWHAFAAAAAGAAEPVGDLWEEAGLELDAYLPGAIEDVMWENELYGVPLDVNALVLMANAEHLDAVGIEADDLATYDGFASAARRLRDGTEAEYAIAVTASSWAAYGWMVAAGGQLIAGLDDEGIPQFTFDDPGNIAALDLLVDLVVDGTAPPPFAPDLSLDAIAAFSSGETALHASGSWDLPMTRRAMEVDSELERVAILPLPQRDPTDPATVLGGSSLYVPQGAEHRELAFAFMLALTSDDVALELAAEEGRLPARSDVYDAPLFSSSPDLAAFVAELPHAEVMPLIAYPEVAAVFRDGLERALSQRRTPREAMEGVQAFAEQWAAQR